MNAHFTLPLDLADLDQISRTLADAKSIVSIWPEFAKADWQALATEAIVHGTDIYVHIDSNILSYLVDVYDGRDPNELRRSSAALMALAGCLGLHVNPTIAVHEYALTGSEVPDQRLAAFYALDNMHPQLMADYSLGRCDSITLPSRETLEPTEHRDSLATHIYGHAFYRALVLKIAEIDLDPTYGGRTIRSQAKRYSALSNWMFSDLGFAAAASFAAAQLWGNYKGKPAIKFGRNKDYEAIVSAVENATWDLVAVESWAEYERKRSPGDPMHLFCSFDRALTAIARLLFVRPTETLEDYTQRALLPFWPAEIARTLTEEYLELQDRMDDPCRKVDQSKKDLFAVSEGILARIKSLAARR